ncbi:hypothetical protein [Pseudomonas sp. HY13-MNA-CIBAN-0226]|uniref:hypothetical protein n=1 Tax=Pseudomonas sp. HY13-MNA-CIBAN-0226 TaxID=3140473 RepID=UPI00332D70BB
MSENTLIIGILKTLNENQHALAAAVEEISNRLDQEASSIMAMNINGALDIINGNTTYIGDALETLEKLKN